MPIVTGANNWEVGFHKQTNESTIGTVADYAYPVFSGRPQPVQTVNRVQVTDAASIDGDAYKNADEHWEADLVVPGFADSLGLALVSLWPTDTKTGVGPYTHSFSGLGSLSTAWIAMYSNAVAALQETWEAGQCAGLGFSFDGGGGPLRVNYKYVGKKPTVANYTKTVTNALSDGYFTAQGAVLKYEEDSSTPVTQTNIQAATVTVDRPVTALATADAVSVSNIGLGKVTPAFTMTLLYVDWQAYRASYYGAVAGSTPSSTLVKGSFEFNFVHTIQAGWSFKLSSSAAVLMADPPQPDASGAPLVVNITGFVQKPASGDHIVPVLINAVSTAY